MIDNTDFKTKAKKVATPEELLKLCKEVGCELSDSQLKTMNLTNWSNCPLYDDQSCPEHFYCIRHSGA